MSFDVDSYLFFPRLLGDCRHGIKPQPSRATNSEYLKIPLYLETHYVYQFPRASSLSHSRSTTDPSRLHWKRRKQTNASVYLFLPELFNDESTWHSLTRDQYTRLYDGIILPAVFQYLSEGDRQHWYSSKQVAEDATRAQYNELRTGHTPKAPGKNNLNFDDLLQHQLVVKYPTKYHHSNQN